MSPYSILAVILSIAYVAADPIIIGVRQQDNDDGGYAPRPAYPTYYGYLPQSALGYVDVQAYPQHHQHKSPAVYYAAQGIPVQQQYVQQPVAIQQPYVVQQQPVLTQTAVVQQQPNGYVQQQASAPVQIYKPAPPPPMVVNPSPIVVRPPPPPPIYVQPQKIFVNPPQVPPVYASQPQVYYAQGAVPGQTVGGHHQHQQQQAVIVQ